MNRRIQKPLQWPGPEARIDLSRVEQMTNGTARLVSASICDADGRPSRMFEQGDVAHFFVEFDVLADLPVAAVGLLICEQSSGLVIYGKNTFQFGTARPVLAGTRLRCRHSVVLTLGVGDYTCDFGLAASDDEGYRRYAARELPHGSFNDHLWECCRVRACASFVVKLPADGYLAHHGLVALADDSEVVLAEIPAPAVPVAERAVAVTAAPARTGPTVLHVTHWKAGSQWLRRILVQAVPDRVVAPETGQAQIFHWPIRAGGVYPTVYASHQEISGLGLPEGTTRFVVIRDLRDTLVSAYFSFRYSHPVLDAGFAQLRERLNELPIEEGMVHLMDSWLFTAAVIQLSWVEAGEPVIRYEDLLVHDIGILEHTLIDRCGLPVSREHLREIVVANRFERLTAGRRRGQEDLFAHERKGIAGDWRNHFTERITRAFKARYGGVLMATGYEKDLDWQAASPQVGTA